VLGGDSLSVAAMLAEVERVSRRVLRPEEFFARPTVADLAQALAGSAAPFSAAGRGVPTASAAAGRAATMSGSSPLLVPLRTGDAGAPIFAVHPGGAGEVVFYKQLACRLRTRRAFYGIQAEGDWKGPALPYRRFHTIEALASRYVAEIRRVQPQGPYHLAGASFGGVVAFEMARQIAADGGHVASLSIFDSHVRNNPRTSPRGVEDARVASVSLRERVVAAAARCCGRAVERISPLLHRHFVVRRAILGSRLVYRWMADEIRYQWHVRRGTASVEMASARFLKESELLLLRYRPLPYDGRITLIRARRGEDALACWDGLARGGIVVHDMPGRHMDMFDGPHVDRLAQLVREIVDGGEQAAAFGATTMSIAS